MWFKKNSPYNKSKGSHRAILQSFKSYSFVNSVFIINSQRTKPMETHTKNSLINNKVCLLFFPVALSNNFRIFGVPIVR